MKQIFVAFFSLFFAIGAARADCATNEFAVGAECIESKFQITTTEMDAGAAFSFYMSAMGTFYVDWGDGTSEKIERTDTTETLYLHTYTSAGPHRIQLGGLATGYSTKMTEWDYTNIVSDIAAIRFFTGTFDKSKYQSYGTEVYIVGISGSLGAIFPTIGGGETVAKQPRFYATFMHCENLQGQLYNTLFAGLSGTPAAIMFYRTFADDINLTGPIPEHIFADISGAPSSWLFYHTFRGCRGLTGSIPPRLFANIVGQSRNSLFHGTFSGCSGLTGSIPEDLFAGVNTNTISNANIFAATFQGCSGLTGTIPSGLFRNITRGGVQVFNATFYGCTNLTGYVPPELFENLTGTGTYMMKDIFYNSGVYTTCPCGTTQYITGYESDWTGRVSCVVGQKPNEHWNNGVCTTDCAAGITTLNTSTGLNLPVLADATTEHSLNVKYNNSVCYLPAANGAESNTINMSYDGNTYHLVAPDEIVPAGFTGQPE